jgi:type II secretory pathway component GspD/PulD (secretin)
VPEGISYISFDPTDNSFIVEGTDEAIQEFIRLINEFDRAPQQVTIKVEFITTSSSVSRSLGFEFLYSRGAVFAGTTPGSFIRTGDPVFLNYGSGNVTARMRTQLLEGFGKVVNAPIIRTLNNQPALVQSSVTTTIFINQVVGNGAGSVIVTPQPFPLNVTTFLLVAPRINGDGTITVALNPQIADFGQLRRGPDGQEIPDQLFQAVSVVARVKNDETIVLGGLTRKSDQGSEARVPILADLPIIGQFFRSTTRDRNNSELLIFVTPHIVEEDEGGINP